MATKAFATIPVMPVFGTFQLYMNALGSTAPRLRDIMYEVGRPVAVTPSINRPMHTASMAMYLVTVSLRGDRSRINSQENNKSPSSSTDD